MNAPGQLTRRELLLAGVGAAVNCVTQATTPTGGAVATQELPTVVFGRSGRTLPRLGFGAFPISGVRDEEVAVKVLRRAIDAGMRYFDTAPSYGNGRSEQRLGKAVAAAIADGVATREGLFIATKTLHRDAAGARRELEQSLKRLGLEYVDSVQAHEVHSDWPRLFEKDSVLSALEKAHDEGLVRHIGITGHRDPADLVEPIRRYEFVSALVPVNPLDRQHLSYIEGFLPLAADRGVAVVAMKIYAGGHLVAGERPPFTAAELVRYALSQEHVALAVPGCETLEHVEEALAGMEDFTPLPAEAQREMESRAGKHQGKKSEWYKNPPT